MHQSRVILISLIVVALGAVIIALVASTAGAGAPRYAVEVLVRDKSEAGKVFEGQITKQTYGKTNVIGDVLNVRVPDSVDFRNKSNKKQSAKSWRSSLQNSDYVTVLGGYRSSDKTIEAQKVVNRSR